MSLCRSCLRDHPHVNGLQKFYLPDTVLKKLADRMIDRLELLDVVEMTELAVGEEGTKEGFDADTNP